MFESYSSRDLARLAEVDPASTSHLTASVFLDDVHKLVGEGVREFAGGDRAHAPRAHGRDLLDSSDLDDVLDAVIARVADPDGDAAALLGVESYAVVASALSTAGVPDSRAALRAVATRLARALVDELPDVAPAVSDRFPGGLSNGTRAWVEVTVLKGPDEKGNVVVDTGDLSYDVYDNGTSFVPFARLHPAPGA